MALLLDRGDDLVEHVRIGAIHDNAEHLSVSAAEFLSGNNKRLPHVIRRAAARGLGLLSTENEQHRGAEVGRDARVESEFGGATDIRIVRAEDDDRVTLPLDGLESRHDLAEGSLGIGVHIVVAHADALFVVQIDPVVCKQHLEHVVTLVTRPGNRAEHPNSLGLVAEGVEHAEGDRRLAGMPLDGGDVNAAGHRPSLSSVCRTGDVLPCLPAESSRSEHRASP